MAGQIFSAYKETLERFPVALPEMANGLMYFGPSPVQIIISGPENEEKTQALIQVSAGFCPFLTKYLGSYYFKMKIYNFTFFFFFEIFLGSSWCTLTLQNIDSSLRKSKRQFCQSKIGNSAKYPN